MPVQTIVTEADSATPDERPYEPRGAALQLFRSKRREVLLAGPAGTGKSRAALEKLNLACMQRPIRAAMVRKVRTSLTQAAMVTFETKVLPARTPVYFHTTDQEYRYPNGAVIVVGGLDNPEKIGSTEFDLIYVQEAIELESDDWGMLLRGLRNNQLSYQQVLADCNPTYPEHWLKQRCDAGECELLESLHADNPTLWDPVSKTWTEFGQSYMQSLDSLKGYQYQRLRLGQWVSAEGMYFQDWDPRLHVCDPIAIPDHWPRWVSVDWGFAVPFCALFWTRDPETRRVYVYDEIYASGLRDEQQAELIKARMADHKVVLVALDPSMFNPRTESQRPSIAQVYSQRGVRHIYPAMNNRKQGWSVCRRLLAHDEHEPRLQIFRGKCPNLVRTLPMMVTDPLDPEDVADAIKGTKVEDHAADAFRYGATAEATPPAPKVRRARFG